MSDLCREVFEKHQAKLLNMDYQELKDQFDRHEQCFRKRYAAFSDFEKEFELWQAAWDVRQVEINQHQLEVHALGQANLNQAMMLAKKDEVITSLQNQLNNMEACYIHVKKERDELQSQVDRVLATMQYNLGYSDYEDMRNPDYHTMLSCLIEIKSLFKKRLRGEHE